MAKQETLVRSGGLMEALLERVAVKSVSFRSINDPLPSEMVRHTKADLCASIVRLHGKPLADLDRQLSGHQEKGTAL
jgi:hypothetical protein